jgi:hypothetical protein
MLQHSTLLATYKFSTFLLAVNYVTVTLPPGAPGSDSNLVVGRGRGRIPLPKSLISPIPGMETAHWSSLRAIVKRQLFHLCFSCFH